MKYHSCELCNRKIEDIGYMYEKLIYCVLYRREFYFYMNSNNIKTFNAQDMRDYFSAKSFDDELNILLRLNKIRVTE